LQDEPGTAQQRAEAMRKVNPLYIPRNHFVEAAIAAAVEDRNFALFEELLEATSRPYEERPELERYARPALPEQYVTQTFCGT
jgi:uncharacterized protein YdiU (UPF0061 family)